MATRPVVIFIYPYGRMDGRMDGHMDENGLVEVCPCTFALSRWRWTINPAGGDQGRTKRGLMAVGEVPELKKPTI